VKARHFMIASLSDKHVFKSTRVCWTVCHRPQYNN